MSHPDAEILMRYAEGLLEGEDAQGVANHLASCQECRENGVSVQAFAARLNTQWLGTRLRTIVPQAWGCPPVEELGRYFLDELAPAERERLTGHLERCSQCQEVLSEMKEGTGTLMQADLLGVKERVQAEPWWERLRAALNLMPRPGWALAAVTVSLAFVVGVLLRPFLIGPFSPLPGVESYRIAKPPFKPSAEVPALGLAPSVKPEADRRFREAMAFYPEPDFPEKAIPRLKEAVAADPSHDQAQFWLGVTHLLKGEARSGIPPLEAAVRLVPGKMEYKQYLVWAYLQAGETDKALRLQTQILERR